MPDRSAKDLWETTLGQLELQVTPSNFATWLRNTAGLRFEGDVFVVGAGTDFAIEWLRSRMSSQINRAASAVIGRPVTVVFEVLGAQPAVVAQTTGVHARTPMPPSLQPNARLTFQSFVVVDSNRLAHRAAVRFSSNEHRANPLVLHGPPGLGKSHLLHAIAHTALAHGHSIALLTAEEFVNRYAAAVRGGEPHCFRDAFHHCDLLLIDDVQFLASRLGSQEQFFNIFNSLHATNKRIAVTCDRVPGDINGLSSHLCSRLHAGICVELRVPSVSGRLDILRVKVAALKHPFSDDILRTIAEQPYSSVRELEGALNRVDMYAEANDSRVTVASLPAALSPFTPPTTISTVQQVLDAVCKHFHISPHDLSGQSRSRDITYARHIAMYLLRSEAHRTLTEIGTLLGNRNHATVISGCRRINSELSALPSTKDDLAQVKSHLDRPSKTG